MQMRNIARASSAVWKPHGRFVPWSNVCCRRRATRCCRPPLLFCATMRVARRNWTTMRDRSSSNGSRKWRNCWILMVPTPWMHRSGWMRCCARRAWSVLARVPVASMWRTSGRAAILGDHTRSSLAWTADVFLQPADKTPCCSTGNARRFPVSLSLPPNAASRICNNLRDCSRVSVDASR